MIQLTPQMRILLAVQPVDFRNYVESIVMLSPQSIDVLFQNITAF
jgi:hypothetical protein